jgi:hypothetical protein
MVCYKIQRTLKFSRNNFKKSMTVQNVYKGNVPAPHSNVPLIMNGNMVTETFRGKYVTKSEHVRQYNLAKVR